MSNPSILQRLQDGAIDFDTALSMIAKGGTEDTEQSPSTRAEPFTNGGILVARGVSGKVLLPSPDEAFELSSAPSDMPRITLLPVDKVPLEDEPRNASISSLPEHNEEHAPEVQPIAVPVQRPTDHEQYAAIAESASQTALEVVDLSFPQPEVALITLRDEDQRNMFSEALSRGVKRSLEIVSNREDLKVVVVQGHGNWFCSGGTPEVLEAIRKGEASFMDDDFFRALLDCPLPTVAAMGGHALGGGCTFGLYADMIVMSESAYYAANFMDHGFTPGVGATFMFPHKLGQVLGTEMLMTANRYQGRELEARGAPMAILPRSQVLPHALELATRIAEKPRLQLLQLKKHLAEPINAALAEVLPKEQAMHDAVFAEHRRGTTRSEP